MCTEDVPRVARAGCCYEQFARGKTQQPPRNRLHPGSFFAIYPPSPFRASCDFSRLPSAAQTFWISGRNVTKPTEREGFEPSVQLPTHAISSRVPSAARTPLQFQKRLVFQARRGIVGPPGSGCKCTFGACGRVWRASMRAAQTGYPALIHLADTIGLALVIFGALLSHPSSPLNLSLRL